jgi:hypothetical protein
VGLTLKRLRKAADPPRFLMRHYRFLSEPRRISKGKPHMVLALHAGGMSVEEISQFTGCPKGTVKRYVEEFEAGRPHTDFDPYFGAEMGTTELCRISGSWHTCYGPKKE